MLMFLSVSVEESYTLAFNRPIQRHALLSAVGLLPQGFFFLLLPRVFSGLAPGAAGLERVAAAVTAAVAAAPAPGESPNCWEGIFG